MRGRVWFNFPHFFGVECDLAASGFEVVNPARLDIEAGFDPNDLPDNWDWHQVPSSFDMAAARERDIKAIMSCDAIYMLEGWENSVGAKAEKALAEWCGLEVMYESAPKVATDDAPRISETQRAVALEEPFDGDPEC
jgi:hypothetical protein